MVASPVFAKSFDQPFSKGCGFKRQSLLSPSADGEMFSALLFCEKPKAFSLFILRLSHGEKSGKRCCTTSRQRIDNPSVTCGDSSLYTREPKSGVSLAITKM